MSAADLENDPFYLRYYAFRLTCCELPSLHCGPTILDEKLMISTGHQGMHGHEFLEFEYSNGRIRYANNSNYRNDSLIRKEMFVSPTVVEELKRIIRDSEITKEDDASWPKKNIVGRQELEVRVDKDHISFETAKIGSLADVNESADAEGLRVFYYLIQDLKCFIFSLITLHFKIKPIQQ